MSFLCDRDIISEGDTVILHLGSNNMSTLQIKKDSSYQTKYGCLRHNDIIGKQFGSKVKCPKGYIYALRPTPELWTINLPHRTQILYATDISMVIMQLDLKPGSIVVESGKWRNLIKSICSYHVVIQLWRTFSVMVCYQWKSLFFYIGVAFDFLCSPLWSKTDVNIEHGSIRLSK